jgi:hypothetical protein
MGKLMATHFIGTTLVQDQGFPPTTHGVVPEDREGGRLGLHR